MKLTIGFGTAGGVEAELYSMVERRTCSRTGACSYFISVPDGYNNSIDVEVPIGLTWAFQTLLLRIAEQMRDLPSDGTLWATVPQRRPHDSPEWIEAMIADIRKCLEARYREGYGYGTLSATVTAFPLNSEPQPHDFDVRDYDADLPRLPQAPEE